jgi:hypothetical protein
MSFGKQAPAETDEAKAARLAQEDLLAKNKKTDDNIGTAILQKINTPGRDATLLTQGTYQSPTSLLGPSNLKGP